MNAMPLPQPDHSEPAASVPTAIPVSLAETTGNGPGPVPPHLLWATLESAYAPPQQKSSGVEEERLAPYIALPMAVGLSLVLWVIIVELVLMR